MANTLATPSYVSTVVAITTDALADETADVLQDIRTRSAVRTILITLGNDPQPPVNRGDTIIIRGLLPRFVDNAVAALRLSSLPTLVWWRRPEAKLLDDVARLVDRVVLDVDAPDDVWAKALALRGLTAFTDLRWTRLTRWRSLMAQFFDLPDVRSSAALYSRLEITAHDPHAARLFAAWIRARLGNGRHVSVSITPTATSAAAIDSAVLAGDAQQLALRLLPNRTCVETAFLRDGSPDTVRIVPVGDTAYASLLSEEMRVRSRDVAFEEALEGVTRV